MKPKDQLIKEIEELKQNWDKRFTEKSIHQPGGGIDNKRDREQFRAGYESAYKYAFRDFHILIEEFMKGYKLMNKKDLLTEEECENILYYSRYHLTKEEIKKLKKNIKEKGNKEV